jgi:putative DNA primase/helicase
MPDGFDRATAARDAIGTDGSAGAQGGVRRALTVVTAHELLAMELPPRETILAPWLPSKGLCMVYGPRGIGKTHVTLGSAYAIATGGTFLGWKADRPHRVLIIDGEMPTVTLQERLAAIVDAVIDEPPSHDFLRILPTDLTGHGLDLSSESDQLDLAPYLEGVDVIFVDNISTLTRTGRENEAESWLPVQEWALEQRRAGRSVVFIHHAGKEGRQRGTSRREDVLDTVIALRRPSDHQADQGARFEVHFEKNRGFHGDDAKSFEATLGAGGWTMRDLEDAEMARVIALSNENLSVRDIATETGIPRSTVSRLQNKARKEGKLKEKDRG